MPKRAETTGLPKRIMIDCSHTLPSGLNTGVQRVVRNVTANAGELRSDCVSVLHQSGAFRLANMDESSQPLDDIHRIQNNVLERMPRWYKSTAELTCKAVPSKQLRKWLLPLPGHQGIFKVPLKAAAWWYNQPAPSISKEPGEGDILLLPDAYWSHDEIWPLVQQAKQRGAFIASIVYDLIPMTHPHFVAPGADASFKQYLHRIATQSDLIVAISDTVRAEVEEAVQRLWPDEDVCQDFRSFELGAQFNNKEGFIRDEIVKAFNAEKPPYLMVGTIDPRKNHNYVLDAFEQVWEQDPTAKLCIVGSISSTGSDIIERIWSHPRYGEQLVALHNVSDAELNYAYKRAAAVCFASIVEGFGLPIVEALWYQRAVFASDTKIHREVGQDRCRYCDLSDPGDLARKILEWEAAGRPGLENRGTVQPKTWKESTQQLLKHCLDAFAIHTSETVTQPPLGNGTANYSNSPAKASQVARAEFPALVSAQASR